MRKLQIYLDKYGPEVGPRLYHILQSQAAHAGVAARLRRKIDAMNDRAASPLPLFPDEPAVAAIIPAAAPPSPRPAP